MSALGYLEQTPEYKQSVNEMTVQKDNQGVQTTTTNRQSASSINLELTDLMLITNIIQTVCIVIIIYYMYNN